MLVETQIKTRISQNHPWCTEAGSDYRSILEDTMRADGRLINIVCQISEDQLQSTRTMIFKDKSSRDSYFGDPIIATLEQRINNYDLIHQISSRVITDGD